MKRRHYLGTVWILVLVDLFGSFFTVLFFQNFLMLWWLCHLVAGLWVGAILEWMIRSDLRRWQAARFGYWISLAGSLFFLRTLAVVQWLVAVVVTMKCSLVENVPEGAALPVCEEGRNWQTARKGKWPVAMSLVLLPGVAGVDLLMAIADKSEFKGLGLLLLHGLLITPFFLVVPALLRIPADQEAKPSVVFLQYLIYVLLAMSWVLLFLVDE